MCHPTAATPHQDVSHPRHSSRLTVQSTVFVREISNPLMPLLSILRLLIQAETPLRLRSRNASRSHAGRQSSTCGHSLLITFPDSTTWWVHAPPIQTLQTH